MPPSNTTIKTLDRFLSDDYCFDCLQVTPEQLPVSDRRIRLPTPSSFNYFKTRSTSLKNWECSWCEECIEKPSAYIDHVVDYIPEYPSQKRPFTEYRHKMHIKCFVQFKYAQRLLFAESRAVPNKAQFIDLVYSNILNEVQAELGYSLLNRLPMGTMFSADFREFYKTHIANPTNQEIIC